MQAQWTSSRLRTHTPSEKFVYKYYTKKKISSTFSQQDADCPENKNFEVLDLGGIIGPPILEPKLQLSDTIRANCDAAYGSVPYTT